MNVMKFALGIAFVLALGTAAQADLLWNDDDAMTLWRGQRTYHAEFNGDVLNAYLDFAVYAPGDYTGVDPSGGTEYVYAYQIFNTINPAATELSSLSVGIVSNQITHSIGTDATMGQLGGIDTSGQSFSKTSARWYFDVDTIAYGSFSQVLLFTSPRSPTWKSGTLWDSGLSDAQPVPSPRLAEVPEPASLGLLAAGAVVLVRRIRRRA